MIAGTSGWNIYEQKYLKQVLSHAQGKWRLQQPENLRKMGQNKQL